MMDLAGVILLLGVPILIISHIAVYLDGKQRNKPNIPVMPKLA